jgi:hypothetical protein
MGIKMEDQIVGSIPALRLRRLRPDGLPERADPGEIVAWSMPVEAFARVQADKPIS